MRARKRPTSTDRHGGAYTCEQTVEERMEGVLRRKRSLFQDIVDELTTEPDKGRRKLAQRVEQACCR